MKKITLLVFISCFSLTVFCQNSNEVELFKAHFNQDKTDLTAAFMDLTSDEGTVFWPIYKAYEEERSKIADKRIKSLYQYINLNKSFTNKQAKFWYKEYLATEKKESNIKKKYFKKLSNHMSPLIALRFFQLNEFVDSTIKTSIISTLPSLENY